MNNVKQALSLLVERGYSAQVNDLCKDIGKAYFAGLTQGNDAPAYRYVCESMSELNRLYKKEFGEFITVKYGYSKKEMYDYAKELTKALW